MIGWSNGPITSPTDNQHQMQTITELVQECPDHLKIKFKFYIPHKMQPQVAKIPVGKVCCTSVWFRSFCAIPGQTFLPCEPKTSVHWLFEITWSIVTFFQAEAYVTRTHISHRTTDIRYHTEGKDRRENGCEQVGQCDIGLSRLWIRCYIIQGFDNEGVRRRFERNKTGL